MRRSACVPRMKAAATPRPPIAARSSAAAGYWRPAPRRAGVRTACVSKWMTWPTRVHAAVGAAGADDAITGCAGDERERRLHRSWMDVGVRLRLPAGVVRAVVLHDGGDAAALVLVQARRLAGQGLDQALRFLFLAGRAFLHRLPRECCVRPRDRPCPCRRAPDPAWCRLRSWSPAPIPAAATSSDLILAVRAVASMRLQLVGRALRCRSAPRPRPDRRGGCAGWPRTPRSRTPPPPRAAARRYRRCRARSRADPDPSRCCRR